MQTAAIWNEQEFSALEEHSGRLLRAIRSSPEFGSHRLSSVRDIVKQIVLGSIRVKAHVVSADEREKGLRNLLNFGHSIGHAFEAILTPQILHGECVSIGMVSEAVLARYLGVLSNSAVSRLTKCLASYELPTSYHDAIVQERSGFKKCPIDKLLSIMGVDKKNDGRNKRIVLLSGIGRTHESRASIVRDQDIRTVLSPAVQISPESLLKAHFDCTPPGSKSISNRVLVLAALGQGRCHVKNLLHSDDTDVMLQALTQMKGATFSWQEDGEVLRIDGKGGSLEASDQDLYVANAGTASRFLAGVCTLAKPGEHAWSVLTGNQRMKARPIGPLISALRSNGAEIEYKETEGSLPIKVRATSSGMDGGDIQLAATVSSQYVSSILMCAPYAKKPVTLRLIGGNPVSQPYIDMTIAMMASFGIRVKASSAEEHTYHIPQGQYQNPQSYLVESDASSATYPLAIAAITGKSCTVSNIGTSSLQGDARFATEVLRPMGCIVEQTAYSTTVKGPPRGKLEPLPTINMQTMTDAFLTASVLAAVAQGNDGQGITRIVGIANQRVKECNRIKAMKDELFKFGVTARELEDGIEINGAYLMNLRKPTGGVHCYDDHRIAMSFSVLALACHESVTIQEKDCVGKTWPTWWDELARNFDVQLFGVDHVSQGFGSNRAGHVQKSILIIGMRGAGKTTAGRFASNVLEWPFIDLDSYLEAHASCTIPDLINTKGWDHFRREELSVLKKCLAEKSNGHVFACGGGIVEVLEARELLIRHHNSGGIVLFFQRDLDLNMEFLQVDKTRPAYVDDPRRVWERRQQWYRECSNYEYFSQASGAEDMANCSKDFSRFLLTITGRLSPLTIIKKKVNSFFVALTVPDISEAKALLDEVVVGSDAIELRVDLLSDEPQGSGVPALPFVAKQVAILRATANLPVIFTIRSRGQGGRFPNDAQVQAMTIYQLALRMGVDFIDLEMGYPEDFLLAIRRAKGHTKIIASHHDPDGKLDWRNGSWIPHYNKALRFGDIIKIVGVAKTQDDNLALLEFRTWAELEHETPVIAINMGVEGQLSRIQNHFLTPVSHPALPFKAAPGQLTAADIRVGLTLHGVLKPQEFYLFGSPIAQSRSPSLHNTLFNITGLPHHYSLFQAESAKDVERLLRARDFGGASVTIPLKLDIMQYLDEISDDARIIGAVNTITVDPFRTRRSGKGRFLTGKNTDWRGITHVLSDAGALYRKSQSALIIGGGGTARAAIYALHEMGYSPLFLLGRSPEKINNLTRSFPTEYQIQSLVTIQDVMSIKYPPSLAIGTIPADRPVDSNMLGRLRALLEMPSANGLQEKLILEMAYKPRQTPLMQLAKEAGWKVIPGLEVLAGQGFYQVW